MPLPLIHFLNVKDGDCNVIRHRNDHVTVIDVCNAAPVVMLPNVPPKPEPEYQSLLALALGAPVVASPNPRAAMTLASLLSAVPKTMPKPILPMTPLTLPGDFKQKDFPVNPIEYLRTHNINRVFRFVLTHPDMDHMDGIKEFFGEFKPANFWDTNNNKLIDWKKDTSGKYSEEDWKFYLSLRSGINKHTNRLALHSGSTGKYYNMGEGDTGGGDGLHVLAPTPELVSGSNEKRENYHGCSYVILYKTGNHRIVFGGDSHDETWEHILAHHKADVTDIDLLIAPHHGRASDRSYDFLNVLNPTLTLFGNAPSEHLAYGAFGSRKLPIITNNQAGCVLIDVDPMDVYVTNKKFAQQENKNTFASEVHAGYHYLKTIQRATKLTPPPRA
jgi:hypothetical protein